MAKSPKPLPTDDPAEGRRKFSIWTLLAPVALILFVIFLFQTLGDACIFGSCSNESKAKSSKKASAKKTGNTNKCTRKFTRVREGDNATSIANRCGMTVEELTECNPQVKDWRTLQSGQQIRVGAQLCSKAAGSPTNKSKSPA